MSQPIIHNLDERNNPPEFLKIGGIQMDISFIPCGVAIPLLNAYDAWIEHVKNSGGEDGIKNDLNKAHENAMLMAKTLSVFTKFYDNRLDEDWVLKNITMQSLGFAIIKLVNIIVGKNSESSSSESKKKEESDGNE